MLRLYVYNTHHNQPRTGAAGSSPEGSSPGTDPPSWCLVIYGRVMDPDGVADATPPGGYLEGGRGLSEGGTATRATAGDAATPTVEPKSATAAVEWARAHVAEYQLPQQHVNLVGNIHNIMVPKAQLTSYLKAVEVVLDEQLYPGEDGVVTWVKSHHTGPHRDSLEIRRCGE